MNKKKIAAIKEYIDGISPVSLGTLFWWGVYYVIVLLLYNQLRALNAFLWLGLMMFNALSIVYGYQWLLIYRKSKRESERERNLTKWILAIILGTVMNIIYCYYTKWQVIGVYFLLSVSIVLVYYFCTKFQKR